MRFVDIKSCALIQASAVSFKSINALGVLSSVLSCWELLKLQDGAGDWWRRGILKPGSLFCEGLSLCAYLRFVHRKSRSARTKDCFATPLQRADGILNPSHTREVLVRGMPSPLPSELVCIRCAVANVPRVCVKCACACIPYHNAIISRCRSSPLPSACDECNCVWVCRECRTKPSFLSRHRIICRGLKVYCGPQ
jgi:hypothetical protein